MAKVTVYDLFNPPGDGGISFEGEESMTHQEFAKECDINNIMARYTQTGILPEFQSSIIVSSLLPMTPLPITGALGKAALSLSRSCAE